MNEEKKNNLKKLKNYFKIIYFKMHLKIKSNKHLAQNEPLINTIIITTLHLLC